MASEPDIELIDKLLASLPCAREHHFPYRIADMRGNGGVMLHGHVRVESSYGWDGGGGRTDLHDLLAILWAVSLRCSGGASVRIMDVEGWCGSPELNSRLLFFDQPHMAAIQEHELDKHRNRLLAHTSWAAHVMLDGIRLRPPKGRIAEWDDQTRPVWLAAIENLTGAIDEGIWISRKNPKWEYFVNGDNTVTVAKLSPEFRRSLEFGCSFWKPEADSFGGNYILKAHGFQNCVQMKVIERAVELIQRVEGPRHAKWRGPAQPWESGSIIFIPTETHCICIGKKALVSIKVSCGRQSFLNARRDWSDKIAKQASIFNADISWRWNAPVAPIRLEQLVETLLSEEPGLQWAKPTGPSYDRDQGRDLVVTWLTPPGLNAKISEEKLDAATFSRKIIVQVKARGRSVGKSDVKDIRDMLDRHNADGILLVAHPVWSNDLFNYLENLAARGYWVGLWSQSDLEERLRRHPYIALRFKDIVEISHSDTNPSR